MYRVYVLCNAAARHYIGLTENVALRLEQHNAGESRWTRGKGPWSIAWTSSEMSLSEARKLEIRLERQGRGRGFYSITGLQRAGS